VWISRTLLLMMLAAPVSLSPAYKLSFQGLGPLYVGMPEARIAGLVSDELEDREGSSEGCRAWRFVTTGVSSPLAGLTLGVKQGRLVRIEIDTPEWQTVSGARVRMPEAALRRIYGKRLREEIHPVDATGRLLVLPGRDAGVKHLALVFESDGDQITRMRAGLAADLALVDECR
jgi:hypothetical protein